MSKVVLTNAYVAANSVQIDDHVSSVTIESTRDEVDVTSMGDTSKEILLGLNDVTITVTVFNDYAAGSIDSQMFALHQTNTPFPVEVRPNDAARSTSNAAYFLTGALLPQYSPIAGSVGDASTTDLVFRNANQAGLTRLTA
jgi:hypothetical protein